MTRPLARLAPLLAVLLVAGCGSSTPSGSATVPPGSPAQNLSSLPGSAAPSGAPSPTTTNGTARLHVTTLVERLPAGLVRAAAFPVTGGFVVAGGMTASGTTATILRVDLAAGAITTTGSLASPVHDAAAAIAGPTLLVIGGGRTVAERVVQSAGTVDGTGGPRVVGALPRPRADASAVSLGGTAYVVGGWTGAAPDPVVLATTDGVRFRAVADLPVAVRYPAVATLGGLIYAIGGDAPTGPTDAIQVVDPATGSARIAGRLPRPLAGATALVVDGRLLVAGGRRGGAPVADVLEIDPASLHAAWIGRLPAPRAEAAGIEVDGAGYLVGGEAASPLASIVSLAFR